MLLQLNCFYLRDQGNRGFCLSLSHLRNNQTSGADGKEKRIGYLALKPWNLWGSIRLR